MNKNYKQLTESIKNRLNPENFTIQKSLSDDLKTISYSDVLVYVRYAMKGVDTEYTKRTRTAGERVIEHLSEHLSNVDFRFQGSVMTNTHIKAYSDIDLLTICNKFYRYDSSNIIKIFESHELRAQFWYSLNKLEKETINPTYQGNDIEDLRNLRRQNETILKDIYAICDISRPKSIKIRNQNLGREVDIVIANWYDDITSIINDKGEFRGIQVYNKETNSSEPPDYPFISIKRINEQSSFTNGRFKKMIRFLKNVKANSNHNIGISSFDINAICYDIKKEDYHHLTFYELVQVVYNQIYSISNNQQKANNIRSVDDKEFIFKFNSNKIENLKLLLSEVEGILLDLKYVVRI